MQKLEEVERLVKELSAREKALHVLVNNAGAAWGATLDDYPVRSYSTTVAPARIREHSTEARGSCQDAAWTKLLTLNLQRVFTLTQKCLPLLRAGAEQGGVDDNVYRDPARIINVSFSSFGHGLCYCSHYPHADRFR